MFMLNHNHDIIGMMGPYQMAELNFCNMCIIYPNFQKQPPRQFSKISVLFLQEQPFYNFPSVRWKDMNFPGGSICSSNRHEFSKDRLYVLQTDTNFPRGLIK